MSEASSQMPHEYRHSRARTWAKVTTVVEAKIPFSTAVSMDCGAVAQSGKEVALLPSFEGPAAP